MTQFKRAMIVMGVLLPAWILAFYVTLPSAFGWQPLAQVYPPGPGAAAQEPAAPGQGCYAQIAANPGVIYTTIQAAIDTANTDDLVQVAGDCAGVNAYGGMYQQVYISKSITLQGGYSSDFAAWDPDVYPTILDAMGQGRVIYVTGDIDPVIKNLHITGGDAIAATGGYTYANGGGVYLDSNLARLEGNSIYNNTAGSCGGGVLVWAGQPTLSYNIVYSNTSDYDGSGVCVESGDPFVNDNLIYNNTANENGGGVFVGYGNATMNRNIIRNNRAGLQGGGLYLTSSPSQLFNTAIVDNQAGQRGSGVYIFDSYPHLWHTTIARNTGGDGSGVYISAMYGSSAAMTNTILVNQATGLSTGLSGYAYADLYGVLLNGNITDTLGTGISIVNAVAGDPAFGADGYHLLPGSAAIDAGVDNPVSDDIDGESRPCNDTWDLGADEWWCNPLADIFIAGPAWGYVNTLYSFTAAAQPPTATPPVYYEWQASGQTGIATTTGSSHTVSFTWDTPGLKLITVTAQNCSGGIGSDIHAINILTRSIPLPTVNLNVGVGGVTLDPAQATDTASASVIEQLFVGLVDLDDETAEIRPELAQSWNTSPDGLTYIFHLRSDAYWTDGTLVTAGDVRYGLLRTLDPATASGNANVLNPIRNAAAFNAGSITDPNQVGISLVDDFTLRIELEQPASYILSILSLGAARPMPRRAIELWGDTWTTLGHLVTNGPYGLTAVYADHLLLDKNPGYYDAANVQIERVKMWMLEDAAAWGMYLDGPLDTTRVPSGVTLDPALQAQIHINPQSCTAYYGFSFSQAPLGNSLLLRKAFAAAVDRQGLVEAVLHDEGQQPALTFAPLGVWGHVDGAAEGVGIPYNPALAQQWLAEAGYPGGAGLQPITLTINNSSSNRAIAERIQQDWYNNLGVNVALQVLPWLDYRDRLPSGEFQIWRTGWCSDYLDAFNFFNEAIGYSQNGFGDWSNDTYNSLLSQAAGELSPVARRELYKEAERILVQTDTIMIPLYYYGSRAAARPYLERSYPASGMFDIATWRITRPEAAVSPDMGSLIVYTNTQGMTTTILAPPGAVTTTTVLLYTPIFSPTEPALPGYSLAGEKFDLDAYRDGQRLSHLTLEGTRVATVTIHYSPEDVAGIGEETLALYRWTSSGWEKVGEDPAHPGEGQTLDTANNVLTAWLRGLSRFGNMGTSINNRIYLPLVLKNN